MCAIPCRAVNFDCAAYVLYGGGMDSKAQVVADKITHGQRAGIRRAAHGRSVSRHAAGQLLDMGILSTDHYPELPENCNVAEWCDWEFEVSFSTPRLTEWGRAVARCLPATPTFDPEKIAP